MARLSLRATIVYLNELFRGTASDYIDIATVYATFNRDKDLPRDRAWIYNRLNVMRRHGLFETDYEIHKGVRSLKRLRLTSRGQAAVHGSPDDTQALAREAAIRHVTIESWKADAKALQALYPEFEVLFDIRLRRGQG